MPDLNPATLREDFPALKREVSGEPLAYLDSAATSQKPRQVIDAISRFYERSNANAHRGIHTLSREATDIYEECHRKAASFIGAADWHTTVLTQNTTTAINLVAQGWARHNIDSSDSIVVSPLEHHSNLVPWQRVAEQTGASLRYLEMDEGRVAAGTIDDTITEDTALVAVTHVSNVLGTVLPVEDICERASAVEAVSLVDAAQSVPHMPVDVQGIGCDFLAFSGHKMCGPQGMGVLYGRKDVMEEVNPLATGGGMVDTVSRQESSWNRIPWRLEPGTPDIAGAAGLSAAFEYLAETGRKSILQHSRALADTARDRLAAMEGVTVHTTQDSPGIVSFTVEGIHPHDVAQILDEEGIAVRAGDHCCQPLMDRLGVDGTVRASFYLYNTEDEVERLVEGMQRVMSVFG